MTSSCGAGSHALIAPQASLIGFEDDGLAALRGRLGAGCGGGPATRAISQASTPPTRSPGPGSTPGSNGQRPAPNSDRLRWVGSTSPPAHTGSVATKSGRPAGREIDLSRAARAVSELLDALGVDRDGEGLADTPARVVRAYAELLIPEPFEATTFPNDEGYDELVLARSIPFSSLCEHHLLPFAGVAHIGYLPGERLLGLSKLARVVTHFSRRLQVQERLTTNIADWLAETRHPKGVGVVLEAEHAYMSLRGVRAAGSMTLTSALAGIVRDDERTRAEFFSLVGCRP
jgi:GTP cyclohydrolase I